jgi:SSS family transporter
MEKLIDYIIIAIYLIGVTAFGIISGGRQKSVDDYFLGGKKLSWWSVGLSIVASETSTLTFISVPGLAYKSNMHFLQLAFGYFLGRIMVSLIFIPAYYRGEMETAYDFIGRKFGAIMRKFMSSVFIATRILASGVRLFATSIPLHFITEWDYSVCITVIGICTLAYTYAGGLKAVVAMDVVQLITYICGAGASLYIIVSHLQGGFDSVLYYAASAGADKFSFINESFGSGVMEFFSSPYTLLGGLLGGSFLSMATHGTDQLLVQRLLSCKSRSESQKALMLDAFCIVLQFAFFLFLGLCLFAFYDGKSIAELGLKSSDEIFPMFITEALPAGVSGFVIAGVLASAMGSLSSSISALASSTCLDLMSIRSKSGMIDEKKQILMSRAFSLLWGFVLIIGAMQFKDTNSPVVEIGLKIASLTYGGMLGVFFLGRLFNKTGAIDAAAGFIASLLVMGLLLFYTKIDFTWHTLIGCAACLIVGNVLRMVRIGLKREFN